MYNIERGRGPIIGDIINSSKFSDSQQDFLLGDEKFNFISRRIDDVSEGMVIKCYQADRLKSNASQNDIKLPAFDHCRSFKADIYLFFRHV